MKVFGRKSGGKDYHEAAPWYQALVKSMARSWRTTSREAKLLRSTGKNEGPPQAVDQGEVHDSKVAAPGMKLKKLAENIALGAGAISSAIALLGVFCTIGGLLLLLASSTLGRNSWSISALIRLSTGVTGLGFSGAVLAAYMYRSIEAEDDELLPEPKPFSPCHQCRTCKYFNPESSIYLWCAVHPSGPGEEPCGDYDLIA